MYLASEYMIPPTCLLLLPDWNLSFYCYSFGCHLANYRPSFMRHRCSWEFISCWYFWCDHMWPYLFTETCSEWACGQFKISHQAFISHAGPSLCWHGPLFSPHSPASLDCFTTLHISSARCELWHISSKLFILTVVCVIHLMWMNSKSQITGYFSPGKRLHWVLWNGLSTLSPSK